MATCWMGPGILPSCLEGPAGAASFATVLAQGMPPAAGFPAHLCSAQSIQIQVHMPQMAGSEVSRFSRLQKW